MLERLAIALSLFAVSTTMVSAMAQAASPPTLREQVQSVVEQERIPGLAIAVAKEGEMLWSEGFGYANLELKVPVTPRTRFRIASISKSLTATCVMRLAEAGKLDLDAPLRRYLPAYPESGRAITVRQLASHRAGIVHYSDEDMINTVHYPTMSAALARFKDRPLASAPGTHYLYSSFGYNLIGAVVESVTQQNFPAAMQACVLGPLSLQGTVPDEYGKVIDNRTAFYEIDSTGAVSNAPAVDNSDLWPGGGYLSTAEDLVRFATAVVFGDFLRPQSRQSMLTPVPENVSEQQFYGMGWSTRTAEGMTIVGHSGAHFGATTRLSVYREPRLAVAVLTNVSPKEESDLDTRLKALADRIARQFSESRAH
ncbi:serine hydrolase domain-containing protein [Steroidobacter sp.]|uniref:serine hydrolase domain-containing protein n=1 Tax=Steroidobacter sp. TaxID=1978227 RepID=UPI001A3C719E|nr:serine hydrolase domain-containing protein [Steroidobacter sp.]MBL8271939.1 beta-lactamase family protein [Steroidobacter sp.]